MYGRQSAAAVTAVILGLALSAGSADAQGKGKGSERADGDRDRVEEGVLGDILGTSARTTRGNGAGKVPPGWCRGQGNPHRTVENCGYQASDVYDDDRLPASRDDRYPATRDDAYARQHDDFHRRLDQKYSRLAAQRRTDVAYQLRLRADKASEHNRWHEQVGIRH